MGGNNMTSTRAGNHQHNIKRSQITPVISAASLKALTRPAASCPVMASTTRSVSDGCTVACTSFSSLIMLASICTQPAHGHQLELTGNIIM